MGWMPDMYAPRKQAGFTLVELMIVVTLVAIVMAAAAPSFSTALTDGRAAQATRDVMRIGRQAYWETIRYRRAHLIYFDKTGGTGGAAIVKLVRGDTNVCNQDWDDLTNDHGACGSRDARCVASIDIGSSAYQSSGGVGPVLSLANGNAVAAICYRANGTAIAQSTLTPPSTDLTAWYSTIPGLNTAAGGLIFQLQTFDNGTAVGMQRQMLFPLGGMPRRTQ